MNTKTEVKHTQGEWKIAVKRQIGCRNIKAANGQAVAWTTGLSDDKEDEANAKLIAAAPDLLKVCEELVEQLNVFSDLEVTNRNRMRQAIKDGLAAIKKATE